MEDERTEIQGHESEEQGQEERTFTQAEVDELINKRMARVKKGLPSDEELNAYREWKAKQNPEPAKATPDELETARMEAEMTRRENYLLRKGIDPDDVDYYVYRISKEMDGETDFEDAAEDYLKKHNKKNPVRMDTGARLNGGAKSKTGNEAMNDIIRNARK